MMPCSNALTILSGMKVTKVRIGTGSQHLNRLRHNRREHEQEVRAILQAMADGSTDGRLDEAGAEELVEHLYQLKHWGKGLQVLKDGAEAARWSSHHEHPHRPQNSGNG